jgi:hypothetical protein
MLYINFLSTSSFLSFNRRLYLHILTLELSLKEQVNLIAETPSKSKKVVSKHMQTKKLEEKKPDGGYGWVILAVSFVILNSNKYTYLAK